MSLLKNIFSIFTPTEYSTPKDALFSQFGHIGIGLYSYYLIGYWALLFWFVWEVRHYILSKNLKDCLTDFIFESIGVMTFTIINPNLSILILLVWLVLKFKLYENDTNN